MSFVSIIKSIVLGGKYAKEKEKAEKWINEETCRIANSKYLANVAMRVFANSNFPAKIIIYESSVAWCNNMPHSKYNYHLDGSVSFSELGVRDLKRNLSRKFVTFPDELHWFDLGANVYIDQVELFARALCSRKESQNKYYVFCEGMDGYGYDNYYLIRKDVKTTLPEW